MPNSNVHVGFTYQLGIPWFSSSLTCVNLKKCPTWELWVKVYLGQNVDCSLGDSTSDSYERLFQRGGGKDNVDVILVKGMYMQSGMYFLVESFFQSCEASVSHEKHNDIDTMKDFRAFLDMTRYKNWAHKMSSWEYPMIWRPVLPVFPGAQRDLFLLSTLSSFQGVLKVSSSSTRFNASRGRWQTRVASASL